MPVSQDTHDSTTRQMGSVIVPAEYYNDVVMSAAKHNVRPEILAAALQTESGFNPNTVSPAGAEGIAQFMPGTARGLGINPNDPRQAIDGMATLLASYEQQFGSEALALAAYNAGPGAVADAGNAIPNVAETQSYVSKILALAGGEEATTGGATATGSGGTSASPGGLSAIVHFFDNVSSAAFWRRIGMGALGVIVAFIAFRQLAPSAAKTITAPVKDAAKVAAVA